MVSVTLIAVYTVVLVLLKDQWWYVLKLSGARNEPGSHWCVGALSSLRCSLRTQVNRSQVPLEERSTWSNSTIVDLNQKPQSSSVSLDLDLNQPPIQLLPALHSREASCFSTKPPANGWWLLFAVDIHFHSMLSYQSLCNLEDFNVKTSESTKWAQRRFTLMVRFD